MCRGCLGLVGDGAGHAQGGGDGSAGGGGGRVAKDNMSCLKGVPAMSQETLLLQELLYCLLGNGGQHIVPLRGSSGISFPWNSIWTSPCSHSS